MRRIFTRDTLKRSMRWIVIVLIACTFFYFWGNYRKVAIDMTLRPELPGDVAISLDMTIVDSEGNAAATFSAIQHEGRLIEHHLDLRPGNYQMRGIATTRSGQSILLRKDIVIPEEDAAMEIYLRP
ncbi:MAG: hypothetical protein IKY83_06535 [Proteobacteria bacterium]|nr:hypothetical protein [Pseudomonadota bacterium]